MTLKQVVVVGASLAGATVAAALRRHGFDGSLLLVGDEPHLPYERPALSKGYLAGDVTRDALLVQPAGTYADLGIDLRLGQRATGLDVERRTVRLQPGPDVPYDVLVIATGGANTSPPVPGIRTQGVHQLRSIDDADRLVAQLPSAHAAVVVGMGFIGCEVAATLRGLGLPVTMVDRQSGPLEAQLGPQLSERVREWHQSQGVRLVTGAAVAELLGGGAVEGVRLGDDEVLPADLVVVGVGVRPATRWLESAPIHLTQGAVGVDELGRTSAPDVYAAGDVAAVWCAAAGEHRRTEHYRAAIDQGERVARAVLGLPVAAPEPSWFWSEQYDHVLHTAGNREGADVHMRADPYAAFFTRGTTLAAVSTIDNGRDFRRALRLLGRDVDVRALADPEVDLRRLRPSA